MAKNFNIPSTEFNVLKEAIECPHCSVMMVPDLLHAIQIPSRGNRHIVVFAVCADSSCELPFLIEFKLKYSPKDKNWTEKPYKQEDVYNYEYEPNIPEDLDSLRDDEQRPYLQRFFEIYEHAHQAHEHGLTEVSGAGFRKSFEFLLKDYAIFRFPDSKKEIEEQPIQQVIQRFQENKQLLIVAERAAWLGNDQIHYTVKWVDKDVSDFINAIKLTLQCICNSETASNLQISMVDKRKIRVKDI